MATYLIDIDGTIFKHSTQEMLPNAWNVLDSLKKDGHKIVITTRRGDKEWGKDHKIYSREATIKALRENRVPYDEILFDCDSPRIVVNDDKAGVIIRETNREWNQKDMSEILAIGKDNE